MQGEGQKEKVGLLGSDDLASISLPKDEKLRERSTEEEPSRMDKNQDNSDRAFYKELVKVIEVSDIILKVLDAQDPLGSRCIDMEKMAMKSGPDKHLVLLPNKIDLIPREVVEKWLKYLREELPTVAFKCSTKKQRKVFNVDEVYNGESSFIGSLVSVGDVNHVEVPPSCPLSFDEKMRPATGVQLNLSVELEQLTELGVNLNTEKEKHNELKRQLTLNRELREKELDAER
ncbi:hypothetical protein GIB67_012337 [Kingdonia uniflora]|uniref:Uncharacterized protein n=1 Tax=Kingdonia uniflora TaxID=39325 RepID=A0A7J7MVW9_9MAGN|nr:hypothetical protein GIB67_012337 [Kingdonia uniflora]